MDGRFSAVSVASPRDERRYVRADVLAGRHVPQATVRRPPSTGHRAGPLPASRSSFQQLDKLRVDDMKGKGPPHMLTATRVTALEISMGEKYLDLMRFP